MDDVDTLKAELDLHVRAGRHEAAQACIEAIKRATAAQQAPERATVPPGNERS